MRLSYSVIIVMLFSNLVLFIVVYLNVVLICIYCVISYLGWKYNINHVRGRTFFVGGG